MTTPAQHMVQALAALQPAEEPDKLAIYISMTTPAPATPPTPASLVIDMLNNAFAATLVLDMLAQQYEAGPPEIGTYEAGPPEYPASPGPGTFEVGPSEIVIPWGFGISVMEAISPPLVVGIGTATLVLDMREQFYAVETFPPAPTLLISTMARSDSPTISLDMLTQSYFVDETPDERGRYEAGAPESTLDGVRLEPDPAYWVDNILINSPDDTRLDLLVLDEAELP